MNAFMIEVRVRKEAGVEAWINVDRIVSFEAKGQHSLITCAGAYPRNIFYWCKETPKDLASIINNRIYPKPDTDEQ